MGDVNPTPDTGSGNPLEELIPVDKRKKVYAVFALAGLVLTVLQTAVLVTNTDGHLPMWLKVTVVCFNLLATPAFALANANAKPQLTT